MPGIPPAPTPEQFAQIAEAVVPDARVVSTRRLVGGLGCRMDVLEMRLANGAKHTVITRQYWERKDSEIEQRPFSESSVLDALAANGVPVPLPVLRENVASEIFGRLGLVISYFDGAPNLFPADPQDWARQLAAAMAKIHAIIVPSELRSVPRSHIKSLEKWMTADEPPERFAKHELGTDLWNAMRKLWPSVDTSANQLIHNDFWPGNTLWKDEQLLAVIDWDRPGLGVPADDVGYFLSDAAYAGLDIEDSFLKTYEEVSGKPVQDLLFWKMMGSAIAMPDIGPWATGYDELGTGRMTPDELRLAHSNHVKNLLNKFNDHS
jgi:aminoglycoside phosphotransferase (APT) family kinase protein